MCWSSTSLLGVDRGCNNLRLSHILKVEARPGEITSVLLFMIPVTSTTRISRIMVNIWRKIHNLQGRQFYDANTKTAVSWLMQNYHNQQLPGINNIKDYNFLC